MALDIPIRWATNTKELVQNLQEGLDQIEATTAAAEKMASLLGGEKLIRSAHNYVAALEQLGGKQGALAGIEKLTNDERERGIKLIDTTIAKYEQMGTTVPRAMQEVSDALHDASAGSVSFSEGLSNLFGSFPVKVAQGILMRDMVHGLVNGFKDLLGVIPNLIEQGSKVSEVAEHFNHLAASSGMVADTLLGKLRDATRGTVTDMTLMEFVSRQAAAGVNLTQEQLVKIAEGAFALTRTAPDIKNTSEALMEYDRALATGTTRGVASLVGKVNLIKAEDDFAASLNTTRDHLNEEGKQQAHRLELINKTAEGTAKIGPIADSVAISMSRLDTQWNNFVNDLGRAVVESPVIITAFQDITRAADQVGGKTTQDNITNLRHIIDDLAIEIVKFGASVLPVVTAVGNEFIALAKLIMMSINSLEGFKVSSQYLKSVELQNLANYYKGQAGKTGPMNRPLAPGEAADPARVAAAKKFAEASQEEDAALGKTVATIESNTKAIEAMTKLQDTLSDGSESLAKKFELMAVDMERVRDAEKSHTTALDNVAGATKRASDATNEHTKYTQASRKELAEATREAEKLKKATADINAIMPPGQTLERFTGGAGPVEAIKYPTDPSETVDGLQNALTRLDPTLVANMKLLKEHGATMGDLQTVFKLTTSVGNALSATWTEQEQAAAKLKKAMDEMAHLPPSPMSSVMGIPQDLSDLFANAAKGAIGYRAAVNDLNPIEKANIEYFIEHKMDLDLIAAAFGKNIIQIKAVKQAMEEDTASTKANIQAKKDLNIIHGIERDGMNEYVKQLEKVGIVNTKEMEDHKKFLESLAALDAETSKVTNTGLEQQIKALDLVNQKRKESLNLATAEGVEAAHNYDQMTAEQQAALIAVQERADLAKQLISQMRNLMPTGVADKIISRIETQQVIDRIGAISQALVQLGSVMGSISGNAIIGSSVSGLGQIGNLYTKYAQAASINANSKETELAKANLAYGAVGVGAGIVAQTINTGAGAPTKNLVAAGALQGVSAVAPFAAATGPWAPVVIGAGAAAGAIAGWIQSGKEWRKVVNDTARDFGGLKISEDFANEIDKIEGDTGLKRTQALTTQLDQLITMAGGLSKEFAGGANNFDLFFGKLHDSFVYLSDGSLTLAETTQILDKNFQTFADAGTDSYGRISDKVRELIDLDNQYGTNSKAIVQWLQDQANALGQGLSDLLTQPMIEADAVVAQSVKDAQKAYDDLKATGKATAQELSDAQDVLTGALATQHQEALRNKDAIADLGTTALLTFNSMIASGSSFLEALNKISPQLSTIQKAYEDLGLAATDPAVSGLLRENAILNGPGGTGKAASGLQQVFTAATNMPGLMTPEMFAAQQRTLASVYTQTQGAAANAGATGAEGTIAALMPFQALLHEMEEWAKKNGVELDASTQEKIQQSKELGIWTDDYKSDSEKTRDAMAALVTSNDALAAAMGGMPAALAAVIAGRQPPPTTNPPPANGTPPPGPTSPQAGGSYGYATGPMTFTTAGSEWYGFGGEGNAAPGPASIFAGDQARSWVPQVQQPEFPPNSTSSPELVQLLTQITEAIRRMPGDTVTFEIKTLDAADFQTVTETKIFPAIVNQLRRGRGLTDLTDVLGRR